MFVFRQKKYKQYSISFKRSYSIIQIAKLFNHAIKFIPQRKGERYKSSVVQKNKGNKIINIKAKKDIKDYILHFVNNN